MSQDNVVLIDVYICPTCEAHTPTRTSYKPRCARTGCKKAARPPISRYCSDACGIAAVYARAKATSARQELYTQVASANNRRGTAEWHGTWPEEARQQAASRSEAIAAAQTALDVIEIRARILQHAEDRQTSLVGDSGPLCGFDERLCWSDEALKRWADAGGSLDESGPKPSTEPGTEPGTGTGTGLVCEVPKRKCKRHTDWSVIRGTDVEVNREMQTQLLAELSEQVCSA
ncbi:COMPASS (complex proteins associated with Set1p) component [Malassezia cuniculi]|uniref:COMPASS (Complex proteins associated with Set1p) component n=1 Tax=Malassezia cuniculi TaxID=948313 RepID=A0AAF0ESQ0_9BASI|nr:COMPASS (complex proteins associated with Set1p) component [Malassezia cuniculi]